MKGDVGMSPHEKKANKRMPTPKQKLIHNPIPTSLFVFCVNILLVKKVSILPAVSLSKTTDSYISERNKDVGMRL